MFGAFGHRLLSGIDFQSLLFSFKVMESIPAFPSTLFKLLLIAFLFSSLFSDLLQVIFGALCHLDKHGGAGAGSAGASLSGGLRPVLSGQEPHNILSLVSSTNRFPLLPLGSQHGNRGGGPTLTTQPLKAQTMSRVSVSLITEGFE